MARRRLISLSRMPVAACLQSDDALGQVPRSEAPAAGGCSIGGGLGVGGDRQEVDLGPLDGQPAVVHQATCVARIGVPGPAPEIAPVRHPSE